MQAHHSYCPFSKISCHQLCGEVKLNVNLMKATGSGCHSDDAK